MTSKYSKSNPPAFDCHTVEAPARRRDAGPQRTCYEQGVTSGETAVRKALSKARRIIVKVGSRVLAREPELPARLAEDFAKLRAEGRSVLLVSSGATALGMERLGMKSRPSEVPRLQAAASAGQSSLMRRYDEAFAVHHLTAAQVLLTHGDLANRKRVNNARETLKALLDAGAIPIINENDVVATEELRFGDNDQLSAMVAPLIGADALVLLSDVEGVLDEQGHRIGFLNDERGVVDHGPGAGRLGTGGLFSKLDAAHKARRSGAAVVIASAAEPHVVSRIVEGADVGTCFPPVGTVLRARQHWIAYTLRPRGTVLVDPGARTALLEQKTSLLTIGVLGVSGEFRRGDSVRIVNAEGLELGRGLTRLSSAEVARAAGKKGDELSVALGGTEDAVVVHRDDLVLDV